MLRSGEWQAIEFNILSQMHAAGKNDAEIAGILSRTDRDIRRARYRLGLETRPAGKLWSAEDVAHLREFWEQGITDVEIGKRLDRNPRTIYAKREALGMLNTKYTSPVNRPLCAKDVLSLPPLSPDETNYKRRASASVAHAIDFKRAGHTFGQGEYKITSEARCVALQADISTRSFVGSQAAMCASY